MHEWCIMNGGSEAAAIRTEQSLYPAAWSSLGFMVLSPQTGPESILSLEAEFGMKVLMLKRLGRGVTRPLHWKKKVQVGGGHNLTSLLAKLPLVDSSVVAFPANRSWNTSTDQRSRFFPVHTVDLRVWTRVGLWSAVWSVTFVRRCRACFTECRWWWSRRLCSCWAGLVPAREPSAPKS